MPPRSNSTTNNQKVVATDKSAPPVGIRLGSALTIGPRIGSGAFGAVHAVVDSSLVAPGNKSKNTLLWACKLTAVPDNGGGTSRKKNGSDAQVAYQQLWAEHLIYTCQCRSLTGTVLPRLPDPTNNNNNDLKDFYDNANGESVNPSNGVWYLYRVGLPNEPMLRSTPVAENSEILFVCTARSLLVLFFLILFSACVSSRRLSIPLIFIRVSLSGHGAHGRRTL